MFSKTLVAALATAALAGLCASASAEVLPAGYETYAVTVRMADLDLAGPAGAATALARIRDAASQVCGGPGGVQDLNFRGQRRRCIAATIDRSVTELSRPAVSAVYAGAPAPHAYAAR